MRYAYYKGMHSIKKITFTINYTIKYKWEQCHSSGNLKFNQKGGGRTIQY